MNTDNHGLEVGPWTIAYHTGIDPSYEGFTVLSPLQHDGVRVMDLTSVIIIENFEAEGVTEAMHKFAEALVRMGFKDGPNPDKMMRMKGKKL